MNARAEFFLNFFETFSFSVFRRPADRFNQIQTFSKTGLKPIFENSHLKARFMRKLDCLFFSRDGLFLLKLICFTRKIDCCTRKIDCCMRKLDCCVRKIVFIHNRQKLGLGKNNLKQLIKNLF